MKIRYYLQGLLIFIFPGLCIPALQAEPEIRTSLEPSHRLQENQTSRLNIEIVWQNDEANYAFSFPEIPLKNLALEEMGETNETFSENGKDWKRKMFRAGLRALKEGEGQIGPFSITYIDPVTQKGGRFEIPARELKIFPNLSTFFRIFGFILTSLTGLAAASLWIIKRKRRARESQPGRIQEVSLEERYLNELTALRNSQDLVRISKLFCRYLCEKYQVPSRNQMTSSELESYCRAKVASIELKAVKQIFRELEENRFGSAVSVPQDVSHVTNKILSYIEGKRTVSV